MATELAKKQEHQVSTVVNDQAMIDRIVMAASDPSVDVDKFERMMAMAERMQAKRAEMEFNQSLTSAQQKMGRIAANKDNNQTRSKYATYDALDRVLRPIYTETGFSLSFDTGEPPEPLYVRVVCHVSHIGGHSRTYHADIPADGKGAKGGDVMTKTHAAGSAMSYGMRYLLKLIFNVAIGEDDDDGNSATIPRITENQVADLRALIEEVGADEAKFLKYLKADSLDRIQATNYADAVAALERKRVKQ